jgi:hypothetical protein
VFSALYDSVAGDFAFFLCGLRALWELCAGLETRPLKRTYEVGGGSGVGIYVGAGGGVGRGSRGGIGVQGAC